MYTNYVEIPLGVREVNVVSISTYQSPSGFGGAVLLPAASSCKGATVTVKQLGDEALTSNSILIYPSYDHSGS